MKNRISTAKIIANYKKITNERLSVISFNEDGSRACSYGGLDAFSMIHEIIKQNTIGRRVIITKIFFFARLFRK